MLKMLPSREADASLGGVIFSVFGDLDGVVLSSDLRGSGGEPLQWSDLDGGLTTI